MWSSPLKPPKIPKAAKEEEFKREKCKISKGAAKTIAKSKAMDERGAEWVSRWIDQYVRENSLPPQLNSNDFVALLGVYMEPFKGSLVLEKLREDYRREHGWAATPDDEFKFLLDAIEADPAFAADIKSDASSE
jgi:hypothetical protein